MSPLASDPFHNSELTTILVASDVQLSKSFYLDLLGAELFRPLDSCNRIRRTYSRQTRYSFQTTPQMNQISHSFTIRVKNCQVSNDILKGRGTVITLPYDLILKSDVSLRILADICLKLVNIEDNSTGCL